MKKQIIEPDYIGGLGPMTKEEEAALSVYLASKKTKRSTIRRKVARTTRKVTAK